MTEKELKRLSRADLLEMLIDQSAELQTLRDKLSAAEAALESRELTINNAGSIAEAALRLNGVFEAAEASGRQYLDNVRMLSERQEAVCEQRERESREKAEQLVADAEARCEALESEAQARCEALNSETRERCEALESETRARCEALDSETRERCEALDSETQTRCEELKAQTQEEIQGYWENVTARLEEFCKVHSDLQELLGRIPLKQG